MAITIKGATGPAPPQATGIEHNPAADAHARLSKKGGARSKRAADLVGDLLDEVVDGAELGAEMEAARKMIDEVCDDLPEGSAMEQAETIADRLKKKIEATRGQRNQLAQQIRQKFDKLNE